MVMVKVRLKFVYFHSVCFLEPNIPVEIDVTGFKQIFNSVLCITNDELGMRTPYSFLLVKN